MKHKTQFIYDSVLQAYVQLNNDAGNSHKRLEARQTNGADDAEFKHYHERAKQYTREFRKKQAVKDARERGEGTKEQLKYYHDLKKDYSAYRSLLRQRAASLKPAKSDPSTFTREYVDYLYERHIDYTEKRLKNREVMNKLRSHDESMPADRQQEYDDLLKDEKEYMRWYRWRRAQDVGEYPPETRAILRDNREQYLEFMRKYLGTPAKRAEAARLKARRGSPAELAAFDVVWEGYKAYTRADSNHRKGAGKVEIDVPEELRGVIDRLEATRIKFNKWVALKKKHRLLWDRLEAGDGTEAELEDYADLKEAALEHRRAHKEGSKMTSRAGLIKGAAEPGKTSKLQTTGRRRWFKPQAKTRRRMRENSKVLPEGASTSGGDASAGEGGPGSSAASGSSPPKDEHNQRQLSEGGPEAANESAGQADSSTTQPPPQGSTENKLATSPFQSDASTKVDDNQDDAAAAIGSQSQHLFPPSEDSPLPAQPGQRPEPLKLPRLQPLPQPRPSLVPGINSERPGGGGGGKKNNIVAIPRSAGRTAAGSSHKKVAKQQSQAQKSNSDWKSCMQSCIVDRTRRSFDIIGKVDPVASRNNLSVTSVTLS